MLCRVLQIICTFANKTEKFKIMKRFFSVLFMFGALVAGQAKSLSMADDAKSNVNVTVKGVTFTMVYVEGGTFTMGATAEQGTDVEADEKPTHKVTLSSFLMGETEVTQALWEAVMGSNPSKFKGEERPVEMVTWNACQEFITKLNALSGKKFRLPTEAEWEYAARGGQKSQGYKFSGSNDIDEVAWNKNNSERETIEVKSLKPNELGLYDMTGNVAEWCSDRYGNYNGSAQTNPKGAGGGSYKVNRGGGWGPMVVFCRNAARNAEAPDHYFPDLGLRLVLVQ